MRVPFQSASTAVTGSGRLSEALLLAAAIGLLLLAALVLAASSSAAGDSDGKDQPKKTRQICITFDELPVSRGFGEVDRGEVTAHILNALQKHEVPAAGFVVSDYIEGDFDLLGGWLNGGHVLGNLTQTHQDLHDIGADNFIREIEGCDQALDPMLEGFGQKRRYFRYPFLHYGDNVEDKRAVGAYLAAMDRVVAHASVVAEDYLYNLSLEKLGDQPDTAAVTRIGSDYLSHVLEQIERSEELAQEVLHRKARQILLLRANRLNALVLDDLLAAISDRGYRFISLDEALKDEVYEAPTAYFGARVVGYIEMIKLSNPDLLPAQ